MIHLPGMKPPAHAHAHAHTVAGGGGGVGGASSNAPYDVITQGMSCPICNESFSSERAVSAHIDDSHPINGFRPLPIAAKSAAFATNNNNNVPNVTYTTVIPLSPLQKSRSAESLDYFSDPLFGLEDFNPRGTETAHVPNTSSSTQPYTSASVPATSSQAAPPKKISAATKIGLSFKGRMKTATDTSHPEKPEIKVWFN